VNEFEPRVRFVIALYTVEGDLHYWTGRLFAAGKSGVALPTFGLSAGWKDAQEYHKLHDAVRNAKRVAEGAQEIFNLKEVSIFRIVRDPKFGLSTGIEQVVWPEVGA